MRLRLHHSLWLHFPAVLLFLATAGCLIAALPLPQRIPMQFDAGGQPIRWGSPWEFAAVMFLLLLFISISIALDESWVRAEKHKKFNWMSLFDEIIVGCVVGLIWAQLTFVSSSHQALSFPWDNVIFAAGGATFLAAVLELLRPWHAFKAAAQAIDAASLAAKLAQLRPGEQWRHEERQDPWWFRATSLIAGLSLLGGAILLLFTPNPGATSIFLLAAVMATGAILCLLVYGGIRVQVSPDEIQVKLGAWGIPLMKLGSDELAEISVHSFSPLADFGGWGIRFGRGMRAYFFRGNRGVMVRTTRGRRYLIGSDQPEVLEVVLKQARASAAAQTAGQK